MDNKSRKLLIRSHFLEKRNIIFIFINIFIFLAVLTTISLLYFSVTYKFLSENKDPRYLTITTHKEDDQNNWIPYDDYSFLDNNNHVVFHIDSKYSGFYAKTNISKRNIELFIKPLLDENEIRLTKKLGKNDIICSKYILTINSNEEIDGIINLKKHINKTLEYADYNLNLLTAYSTRDNMSSMNTCYVSKETYEELSKNIEKESSEIIRVDKKENINYVKSELFKRGLKAYTKQGNGDVNLFIIVSIFIALIVTIISFTILFNFVKKKTLYRMKRYGILRVSGYKDKDIIKLEIIENTFILIVSFIIAYIIFTFMYKKTIISVLYEFLLDSLITVYIPLLIPILSFALGFVLTTISINKLLKHYFKYDISEMFRSD